MDQPDKKDLDNFDYRNANLNQCSDKELKEHKSNMDKGFNQNQLKPGDPGFQYDKRIDFNAAAKVDNSWDDDDDYFDDDF